MPRAQWAHEPSQKRVIPVETICMHLHCFQTKATESQWSKILAIQSNTDCSRMRLPQACRLEMARNDRKCSRKAADEAAVALKMGPWRVENRPRGRLNGLWRPLGSSWAAAGRQMAAKTALEVLLGGFWGGLGGSWAVDFVFGVFQEVSESSGTVSGIRFWTHFWGFCDVLASYASNASNSSLLP